MIGQFRGSSTSISVSLNWFYVKSRPKLFVHLILLGNHLTALLALICKCVGTRLGIQWFVLVHQNDHSQKHVGNHYMLADQISTTLLTKLGNIPYSGYIQSDQSFIFGEGLDFVNVIPLFKHNWVILIHLHPTPNACSHLCCNTRAKWQRARMNSPVVSTCIWGYYIYQDWRTPTTDEELSCQAGYNWLTTPIKMRQSCAPARFRMKNET